MDFVLRSCDPENPQDGFAEEADWQLRMESALTDDSSEGSMPPLIEESSDDEGAEHRASSSQETPRPVLGQTAFYMPRSPRSAAGSQVAAGRHMAHADLSPQATPQPQTQGRGASSAAFGPETTDIMKAKIQEWKERQFLVDRLTTGAFPERRQFLVVEGPASVGKSLYATAQASIEPSHVPEFPFDLTICGSTSDAFVLEEEEPWIIQRVPRGSSVSPGSFFRIY